VIIYSTEPYKFTIWDKKTPPPKGGKRRRHRKINHGGNLTIELVPKTEVLEQPQLYNKPGKGGLQKITKNIRDPAIPR
jgi:hypothetical protein